jgi:hypothetical protein
MRQPGSIVHLKKTLRRVIYRLKWKFGRPADLYRDVPGEYDPKTGQRPLQQSKIHIDRMIVFPGLIQRDFFFSISVIRANSQFVTGGDVALDDRQFIVDSKDLPKGYEIRDADYIVMDNQRWDLKTIEMIDEGTGYFLSGRKIVNQIFSQIREDRIKTKLTLTSAFEEEE